jgi:hypothetical protein
VIWLPTTINQQEKGRESMDGMRFCVSVHLHGTLAANAGGRFVLPCGASLVEVSAGSLNAGSATLKVGAGDDDDGILTDYAIGASGVPDRKRRSDFDGALADGVSPLHLAAGTVVHWTLDYDGDGGTAAQNVSLLFTFLEG